MLVYLAVLLSLLQGISRRGAKKVVSLSALSMGAMQFQVGIIGGLFALFPLFLAVTAGKLSDRIGVKRPIVAGAALTSNRFAIFRLPRRHHRSLDPFSISSVAFPEIDPV